MPFARKDDAWRAALRLAFGRSGTVRVQECEPIASGRGESGDAIEELVVTGII